VAAEARAKTLSGGMTAANPFSKGDTFTVVVASDGHIALFGIKAIADSIGTGVEFCFFDETALDERLGSVAGWDFLRESV